MHELRGVERRRERERDREDEGVEGPLQRAVDERRQAELRLEVVRAARRLPDVVGPAVALVPDLPEERAPGHLGMRVPQLEVVEPSVLRRREDSVRLRREDDGGERRGPGGEREERLPGRGVVDRERARGVGGDEALVPPRRGEGGHGRAVAPEVVDPRQAARVPAVGGDDLPGGDPARGVPRDERPVAVQESEDRHLAASARGRNGLFLLRALLVPQVEPDDLPGRRAGEDVLAPHVQRERPDLAAGLDREDDRAGLARRLAHQARLLGHPDESDLPRPRRRERDRAVGPANVLEDRDGPSVRVHRHRLPGADDRRHAPLAVLVSDLRRDLHGIEAPVREAEDDQLRLRRAGLHDRRVAESREVPREDLSSGDRKAGEARLRRDERLLAVLVDGEGERYGPGREAAGRDRVRGRGNEEGPDDRHDHEEDREDRRDDRHARERDEPGGEAIREEAPPERAGGPRRPSGRGGAVLGAALDRGGHVGSSALT